MQKILIADDSKELLDVLSMLLSAYQYQSETVLTGQQLLDKLQLFEPDLILLDVMLGGSDGRELCLQIKQTSPAIPIILFSANPELLLNFEACKADAVIEKPFDINFVIEKIQKLLCF